jgi:hypothetical protein
MSNVIGWGITFFLLACVAAAVWLSWAEYGRRYPRRWWSIVGGLVLVALLEAGAQLAAHR